MAEALPKNVISIRLFGSTARGEQDELSDADILVVVEDRSGKVPERTVKDLVEPSFGVRSSISWYGQRRLQRMFTSGHLFAWHLHYESQPLWGPARIDELFGEPAAYRDALLDISSFSEVMRSLPAALYLCPHNAIYEMGLLYVCIRNIAMSASWHFCDRPDFTRYSPFRLGLEGLPASQSEYDSAMKCRMASQRGLRILESVTVERVLALQEASVLWSERVAAGVDAHDRQRSESQGNEVPGAHCD